MSVASTPFSNPDLFSSRYLTSHPPSHEHEHHPEHEQEQENRPSHEYILPTSSSSPLSPSPSPQSSLPQENDDVDDEPRSSSSSTALGARYPPSQSSSNNSSGIVSYSHLTSTHFRPITEARARSASDSNQSSSESTTAANTFVTSLLQQLVDDNVTYNTTENNERGGIILPPLTAITSTPKRRPLSNITNSSPVSSSSSTPTSKKLLNERNAEIEDLKRQLVDLKSSQSQSTSLNTIDEIAPSTSSAAKKIPSTPTPKKPHTPHSKTLKLKVNKTPITTTNDVLNDVIDNECPLCMSPLKKKRESTRPLFPLNSADKTTTNNTSKFNEFTRYTILTPCGHTFHLDCLQSARACEHSLCPICRVELPKGITPAKIKVNKVEKVDGVGRTENSGNPPRFVARNNNNNSGGNSNNNGGGRSGEGRVVADLFGANSNSNRPQPRLQRNEIAGGRVRSGHRSDRRHGTSNASSGDNNENEESGNQRGGGSKACSIM